MIDFGDSFINLDDDSSKDFRCGNCIFFKAQNGFCKRLFNSDDPNDWRYSFVWSRMTWIECPWFSNINLFKLLK